LMYEAGSGHSAASAGAVAATPAGAMAAAQAPVEAA
jgi:hypothetical protein